MTILEISLTVLGELCEALRGFARLCQALYDFERKSWIC